MLKRGRRTGSDATALQESPEPTSIDAAKMMPVRSTSEIATAPYQLWLDNTCPIESQEDWFRAELMLKNAPVAKCEDLSRRPSMARRDTRTEAEMEAEFRWQGHWEVWESEWSGPHWVWD